MPEHPVIILTTTPDLASAEKIANLLVERRLAACVNLVPEVRSVYFWKGEIVRDKEIKLFIKTASHRAEAAAQAIKDNHPYTVPEITTLGLTGGVAMHDGYWQWLIDYVGR
ncbi:MAG: divalent-cation tolerance protein CutA [Leptospiraceae bacterium]|nr:divalent-cation tolerance protein CutA [Leptospiraceae bacterium]MCX7634041.1 divalent-cation tolerance protein CutA [Turneriella sp.]